MPRCLFHLSASLEGGDAASLERLSASTEFHQKRGATRQHSAAQRDREQASVLYGTQPETRLRVVPIKGDGRCLFRALVGAPPCHADLLHTPAVRAMHAWPARVNALVT